MDSTKRCSIDGCEKEARERGWCPMHYQRWRHHGDPLIVKRRGKMLTKKHPRGYCQLIRDGRRVLEHRLVMEGILGRRLLDEEVVHHKDRNPANNDPSNLQLLPSKAEHNRLHQREDVENGCKRGHRWDEGSFSIRRDGRRVCLVCSRLAAKRRRDEDPEEFNRKRRERHARKRAREVAHPSSG